MNILISFKNTLKNFISFSINLLSKLLFVFYSFKKRQKMSIICPPASEGSLGDEAIINSITTELKNKGHYVAMLQFVNKNEYTHIKTVDKRVLLPNYFSSGGWKERIKLIKIFSSFKNFFLLGTDMLDGNYADWYTLGLLKLTHQAAFSGLNVRVVGFSLNEIQDPKSITALNNLPKNVKLYVRDPVSLKRAQSVLTKQKLVLTADMAFRLNPVVENDSVKEYMKRILSYKENAFTIIGININPQLFLKTKDLENLIISFTDAISKTFNYLNSNVAFVLIPHDFRKTNNDLLLLQNIYDKLSEKIKNQTILIKHKVLASEIKYIIAYTDFVLTARMHVAIAALGQKIPIACVVYQGKFEGLCKHFDIKNNTIEPSEAIIPDKLFQLIKTLINSKETTKKLLEINFEKVQSLSLRNLE